MQNPTDLSNKVSSDIENLDAKSPHQRLLNQRVYVSCAVATFYILVSGSMVFVNKGLMQIYHFEAINLLLLMQFIFTAALLTLLRHFSILKFEEFNIQRAKLLLPISIFYCANTSVALLSLRGLNVAAYSLIKRLTPIVVLVFEIPLLNKYGSLRTWIGIFWMVVGTIVAANNDPTSSLSFYMLGFLSCCLQALYLIFVKKSGAEAGLDSFGVLYYHSILSIPLIIPIVYSTDELSQLWMHKSNFTDMGFILNLILNLSFGALLNFALFLCTQKTSPATTMVSGHVKSIAQIIIGLFTFGGIEITNGFLVGIVLSVGGGCLYVYDKYDAMRKE